MVCDNACMQTDAENEVRRGVDLLNRGDFFAAHEVLEDVWRAAPTRHKPFLQGLVQVAVALHHYSTGNRVGAVSVMNKARCNLESAHGSLYHIELKPLLTSIHAWLDALRQDGQCQALPGIVVNHLSGPTLEG
jgi:predicted metal-dependent hydrolase